jgi:intermembrane space import and assembly protein 40
MSFDEDGNEVWYFILLLTFEWDAYISLSYLLYYFLAPWMISELSILCIQSIDVKVQKALDCPCVAELKNGPCGSQFVDAFSCFLKSTEEEKGSDCVKPFIALQDCIKINPEAFSKEILEEEENDEEAEKSNLKVRAPAWSRESKPKL